VPLRFSGPFFNEFVAVAERPEKLNETLLEKKIIGGLAIECWYPELANGLLLCATEMSRRADMDAVGEVFAR
jgi:glycine dehydrogenase subunit 1